MPVSKKRKNAGPYQSQMELVAIWSNDDLATPTLDIPHVQADELAGCRLVTVWDYRRPGPVTLGLLAAAASEFGVTAEPSDTIETLRAKLTRAAADEAIEAAKSTRP